MPYEAVDRYDLPTEIEDLPYTILEDTTPESIMDVVKLYAKDQADEIVSCDNLRLNVASGRLTTNNRQLSDEKIVQHTTYALGQLLTYLRIPRPYFRRCPISLKVINMNHWLRQKGDKDLLMRKWSGIARAFFTTRFTAEMDDLRVMPVILQALKTMTSENGYRIYFAKTSGITRLVVNFNHIQTTRVEDIPFTLQGALEIVNSEIGLASLRIQPCVRVTDHRTNFIFHLADHSAPGARRFKHVGDTKLEKISEALDIALKVAENAIPVALNSLILRVERPKDVLERIYHANPFMTQTIMDGIADSLDSKEEVLKGDLVTAILKACESVIPFQTRLDEKLEAERSMAKYLGFLDGLDEQIGNIISEAVVQQMV